MRYDLYRTFYGAVVYYGSIYIAYTRQRECTAGDIQRREKRYSLRPLHGRQRPSRACVAARCNCNRACRGRNRGEQCLGKIDAHAHVCTCVSDVQRRGMLPTCRHGWKYVKFKGRVLRCIRVQAWVQPRRSPLCTNVGKALTGPIDFHFEWLRVNVHNGGLCKREREKECN